MPERAKHNDEKNINHEIGTQNISNHVVEDVSSDRTNNLPTVDTIPLAANKPNKANLKTNVLSQEIALPCRESLTYISSQLNKGKKQFCISIELTRQPKLSDGYISLSAFRFTSPEDMKQILIDSQN
jgi:hypothetical protein